MSLAYLFAAGLLISMIPGPVTSVLLAHQTEGRLRPRQFLWPIFICDLGTSALVIALLAMASFDHALETLRFASAAFLILFVAVSLKFKKLFQMRNPKNIIYLILFNPGHWLSAITLFAWTADHSRSVSVLAPLAYALGATTWFYLLHQMVKYCSETVVQHMKSMSLIVMIVASFILLIGLSSVRAESRCNLESQIHQSRSYLCQTGHQQPLRVLHLKGNFAQQAYDHAHLLKDVIPDGILGFVKQRFDSSLSSGSMVTRNLKKQILACYVSRMRESVSKEFLQGITAFHSGLASPHLSAQDILQSALAVDLSIATEGLSENLRQNPILTSVQLATECGIQVPVHLLRELTNLLPSTKWGCLGFVAPKSQTVDGALIHARNFDADLAPAWQKYMTFFVIEEPGHYKFVAAASAGLIYPGGVSGMNEKGISVSLHQLGTREYLTHALFRKAAVAPFLQHRILREAASIDEAIQILSQTKHFGAWTFLVSDAKTQEVAAIEVAGRTVRVARRTRDQAMAQANHFLDRDMIDRSLTQTFNKVLESLSRFKVIERNLAHDKGNLELSWAIDQLAGHEDYFEGFRSFGRTATKVYTVMSTIARPEYRELWMTVGERMPASHNSYVGIKMDWGTMNWTLLETHRTQKYAHLTNWESSLHSFALARIAYEHSNLNEAIRLLEQSRDEAKADKIEEIAPAWMLFRLAMQTSDWAKARQIIANLQVKRDQMHPYHQALLDIYDVWAEMAETQPAKIDLQQIGQLERALTYLNQTKSKHKYTEDLKANIASLIKSKVPSSLPALQWITIE